MVLALVPKAAEDAPTQPAQPTEHTLPAEPAEPTEPPTELPAAYDEPLSTFAYNVHLRLCTAALTTHTLRHEQRATARVWRAQKKGEVQAAVKTAKDELRTKARPYCTTLFSSTSVVVLSLKPHPTHLRKHVS